VISKDLVSKAKQVLSACRRQALKVATAESCTGGLIAATLTEIAGSSDVVERGFVTYSNEAKVDLVSVPPKVIAKHGAVSEIVARAMAEGARRRAHVDIAVSVTGIAGPGGGSPEKPVGLVHLACARTGRPTLHRRVLLKGNRAAIRRQSVAIALAMVLQQVKARPARGS
jgi:nicotinamide-nucleotide amidase